MTKELSRHERVLCFVHPKEMRDFKEVNGKKEFNIYFIYSKYNLFEIFTHGLINVITSIKKMIYSIIFITQIENKKKLIIIKSITEEKKLSL